MSIMAESLWAERDTPLKDGPSQVPPPNSPLMKSPSSSKHLSVEGWKPLTDAPLPDASHPNSN